VNRLYYTDSYLSSFEARVIDTIAIGGRPAVILDRTAFYPTSGGQPFDTGRLGAIAVIDVVDLDDGRVAHIVSGPIEIGTTVQGAVDWPRRFDHMQQHTGQHVLSAAFDRLLSARTESFHLGQEECTIDLSADLQAAQIDAAALQANRVVWEDRPVAVRFVSAADAAALPLRKAPAREGTVRVVDVEGFDLSACGGTHVARTGSIGMIAISAWERFKGGTRVAFLCGGRALRRFGAQRDVQMQLVRRLSVLPGELPGAVERLQDDAKVQRGAIRGLQTKLARFEADRLISQAAATAGRRVVVERMEGFDAAGLKALAAAIVGHPTCSVCLLGAAAPFDIIVARAADVGLDASAVLRQLTARFGGKGGGRPELAQGGGLSGEADEILSAARELLHARLG
jgi:alanyl-tRNA synthetase